MNANTKFFSTLGVFGVLMIAAIFVAVGKTPMNTTGDTKEIVKPNELSGEQAAGFANTAVSVAVRNAISKASVTDSRGYIYANDNSIVGDANDVALDAATHSLTTTAPTSVDGYAMIGNDANQGTDGGTEWYYHKVPVSWSKIGSYSVHDAGKPNVEVYAESASLTLTGYEENTVESSLNITVGTSPVKTGKIKIEPAASSAIGNPEIPNPLGVCFNVTTDSNWNDITPYGVKYNKITTPEAYKGYNIIGCYEFMDTDALADDSGVHNSEYTFGVNLDPAANPVDEWLAAYIMDKTYYLDDNAVWQVGFADNSLKGTDYDPGFNGQANAKVFMAA